MKKHIMLRVIFQYFSKILKSVCSVDKYQPFSVGGAEIIFGQKRGAEI